MSLTLRLLDSLLDRLLHLLPEDPARAKRLDDILDPEIDGAELAEAELAAADVEREVAAAELDPAGLQGAPLSGARVVEGAPPALGLVSNGDARSSQGTGTL
jgi:hypothetical protein